MDTPCLPQGDSEINWPKEIGNHVGMPSSATTGQSLGPALSIKISPGDQNVSQRWIISLWIIDMKVDY